MSCDDWADLVPMEVFGMLLIEIHILRAIKQILFIHKVAGDRMLKMARFVRNSLRRRRTRKMSKNYARAKLFCVESFRSIIIRIQ